MEKLKVKDLISIGIFTAIYLVIFFVFLMFSGVSPFTYLFSGAVSSLLLGSVYMLYLAKNGKRFSILIMGVIITTLVAFMLGGLWTVFLFGYAAALLAELVARAGKYKSFKWNTLSFVIFSFWSMGVYSSFWIIPSMIEQSAKMHDEAYAVQLKAATTPGMLVALIAATVLAAVIGSLIGKALMKKHFERAGIV